MPDLAIHLSLEWASPYSKAIYVHAYKNKTQNFTWIYMWRSWALCVFPAGSSLLEIWNIFFFSSWKLWARHGMSDPSFAPLISSSRRLLVKVSSLSSAATTLFSSLLPHRTEYRPSMMRIAPIILNYQHFFINKFQDL